MILAKGLFVEKKDLKNTDKSCINKNRDDSNHGKKKTSSKKTESWYYVVCCVDAVKDMRLYAICGLSQVTWFVYFRYNIRIIYEPFVYYTYIIPKIYEPCYLGTC